MEITLCGTIVESIFQLITTLVSRFLFFLVKKEKKKRKTKREKSGEHFPSLSSSRTMVVILFLHTFKSRVDNIVNDIIFFFFYNLFLNAQSELQESHHFFAKFETGENPRKNIRILPRCSSSNMKKIRCNEFTYLVNDRERFS